MGLDVQPGRGTAWNDGVVYYDPRTTEVGCRAILPKTSAVETLECADWASGHLAEYDKQRIALGAPDGSRDMVIEKAILLENNFDPLNGVDWEKGCYVGQRADRSNEISRPDQETAHAGRIRRRNAFHGTRVSLGGKDAGEIRSVQGDVGLALLRLEKLEEARVGDQTLLADSTRITPKIPIWAAKAADS